jgi:hypothetical protein
MERARDYQPLADIAIDEVRPDARGFTLTGQGADRAEYRLGLRFDMPLDTQTRAVLGELLSQAEVTVARRAAALRARRERRGREPQAEREGASHRGD